MNMPREELSTYRAQLPALIEKGNEGKYVVIRGQQLVEVFATYEAALDSAYEKFGLEPFFVKKISRDQSTVHFTRDLGPCRT